MAKIIDLDQTMHSAASDLGVQSLLRPVCPHSSNSWPWWLSWMHSQLVIRSLLVRPLPGLQDSYMEINHEIFSKVMLSLPVIKERHLSVSGKRMCTNCLTTWRTKVPRKKRALVN